FQCTFDRSCRSPWRLRDVEFVQQFSKALAILREIDRLRRRSDDRNSGGLKRQSKVQRCLSAELDDHSNLRAGLRLVLVDFKNIFQRQRFEVETIAGVV